MSTTPDSGVDDSEEFHAVFDETETLSGDAEPLEEEAASRGELGLAELTLAVTALAAWFVFFAGGVLIGTVSSRAVLASAPNVFSWLHAFTTVLLFWTITNVGILSCIAAFLGAVGRRTKFTVRVMQNPDIDMGSSQPDAIAVFYLSAIMRGFGIYALSFAGLLLLATESFENPTQDGYLRLAATMSVLSFYAGYDPETFAGLLDRVKKVFESK